MRIKEAQEKVDKWIKEIGVKYFGELTNTAILNEEVGELSSLMARIYGEQSFKKEISEQEAEARLKDEMADVLFVLICLANQTGVDLEIALIENLQKKTTRDKDRHKNNSKLQ